jgi:DNA polymerase-3 subunit delta
MEESKPIVYLLHGDDHFGLMAFIETMIGKMGEPATAQMNISRLTIGINSEGEIKSACLAIPFLSERRLVILTGFSNSFKRIDEGSQFRSQTSKHTPDDSKELVEFFNTIPASTALVLVVEDEWVREKGEWNWKILPDRHWLISWVKKNPSIAREWLFALPRGRDMVTWIEKQTRKMGGQISPAAAQALALGIGNDTQLAHQELDKLLTYVDYRRAVEPRDIELLTVSVIKQNIFDMVDSIGRRDVKRSLDALYAQLTESAPEELMGMIIRQFRLLIIIKEAMGTAMSVTDICVLVRLPAGIVERLISQAKGFDLHELKEIYHQLLELDLSNKTSQMPADLALDAFVVSLAAKTKSS